MATITARFASRCPKCGGGISAGDQVNWEKGSKASHLSCPAKAASDPKAGNNRKAGHCDRCGLMLQPGEGRAFRCLGSSSNCERHWDTDDGGWHLECSDTEACTARVQSARAASDERKRAAASHRAAVQGLFHLAMENGERPEASFILEGEEIPLAGSESRIYGGGQWAVIEPAGDRVAPDSAEVETVRAEYGRRVDALKTASEALIAWTAEHLPADAPYRVSNCGRTPYDGMLWGKDLATLSPADLPAYEALKADVNRLSYVASPDSYHAAQAQLAKLEQQVLLASYGRSVWLVRNNGHDGDCWNGNNVRTGGAGAIGWRLPWSQDLEDRIRAAREPSEEEPGLSAARSSAHLEDAARES